MKLGGIGRRSHAQKGNKRTRDKRELNIGHKRTLSISMQESNEGTVRSLLLRHPKREVGRTGQFKSPDHKLRACRG